MKVFKKDMRINCRTVDEQNMVLDIFEMLGYRWNAGERPRQYQSYSVPMCYSIYDSNTGKFVQNSRCYNNGTEAKDLHNMWISLKRRRHEIKQ